MVCVLFFFLSAPKGKKLGGDFEVLAAVCVFIMTRVIVIFSVFMYGLKVFLFICPLKYKCEMLNLGKKNPVCINL